MKFKVKKYTADIVFLFLITLIVAVSIWQIPTDSLNQFVADNLILGGSVFIFLMIVSTVIPPITVFPVIPFVAVLLGPFTTAIYSVIGWTIGSMISFLIARHCGKPFLSKFISSDKLKKYEKKVSSKNEFWVLVFLRMIIPVDILSYAVGVFSKVSFTKYSLASFLGVIPFSFVFSYGYDIIFLSSGFIVTLGLSILVLTLGALYLFKKDEKN